MITFSFQYDKSLFDNFNINSKNVIPIKDILIDDIQIIDGR